VQYYLIDDLWIDVCGVDGPDVVCVSERVFDVEVLVIETLHGLLEVYGGVESREEQSDGTIHLFDLVLLGLAIECPVPPSVLFFSQVWHLELFKKEEVQFTVS